MTNQMSSPEQLLASWRRFVQLLGSPGGIDMIATADGVEGLLVRSSLERAIDAGASVDVAALASVDDAFRAVGPKLAERTRMALYLDDAHPGDWWWSTAAGSARPEDGLDVASAARLKGVHVNTIRAAIHRRELPARQLSRTFLIARRDLDAWHPRPAGRPARFHSDQLLQEFMARVTARPNPQTDALAEQLALDPSAPARSSAVALWHLTHGRFDDASDWVNRARGADTSRSFERPLAFLRGIALLGLGRARDAVAELEPVYTRDPGDPSIADVLAQAFVKADRIPDANRLVAKGLTDPQRSTRFLLISARVKSETDRPVQALVDVTTYLARSADDWTARLLQIAILGRLNDKLDESGLDDAILRILDGAPDDFDQGQRTLGLALARAGKWRRALELAASIEASDGARLDVANAAILGALTRHDRETGTRAVALAEKLFGSLPLANIFKAFSAALDDRVDDARDLMNQTNWHDIFEEPALAAVATAAWIAIGQPNTAVSLLGASHVGRKAPVPILALEISAAVAANDRHALQRAVSALAESTGELGQVVRALSPIINTEPPSGPKMPDHRSIVEVASTRVTLPAEPMGKFPSTLELPLPGQGRN